MKKTDKEMEKCGIEYDYKCERIVSDTHLVRKQHVLKWFLLSKINIYWINETSLPKGYHYSFTHFDCKADIHLT